jgi:Flp pilus assembly protein TadG
MTRMLARRFAQDRRGATAVEFGLLLPVFLMLVVGVINVSLLTNAVSSMNFAVQEAARCSSVNHTTCASADTTVSFAQSKYKGPGISPVFVSNNTGCGHTVSATATYDLNVAVYVYAIPIHATACYP